MILGDEIASEESRKLSMLLLSKSNFSHFAKAFLMLQQI
jgi:hypothetical protein